MKSSNLANLRLLRPENRPVPSNNELPEDLPSDSDLANLEAWLLSDSGDTKTNADRDFSSDRLPSNGNSLTLGGLAASASAPTAVSIALRLESVLQGAVEGLGFESAGLYLLDDATTALSMRSMWRLSPVRLIEDARPLRGAVADLEAMCGSAVVLEDGAMNAYWRVPEPCAASVCLPVSTSTTVIGTVWFFSESPRRIDEKATNLLEIIAGRLAVELELEELQDAHRAGLWAWKSPSHK